jgi:co-chaperonin GroES (HSP10)
MTTTSDAEQLDSALPTPVGFKILIAMPEVSETYDGSGLIKPKAVLYQEEVSSVVALVLDLGPDAYKDKDRFPSGPLCAVGDYILIRAYSGTRFKVYNKEFRLINDDTVEAIVPSPAGYSRI